MPLPHFSQSGILGALPAPPWTLVTGALTLLVPAGRSSEKQSVSIYGREQLAPFVLEVYLTASTFVSILKCAL